jgi:hypothetical protein
MIAAKSKSPILSAQNGKGWGTGTIVLLEEMNYAPIEQFTNSAI